MRINSHLLSTVEFRSDALGVLCSITHPINRATPQDSGYSGLSVGKIYQSGNLIATFDVTSSDDTEVFQVMIDLARSKGTRKAYPINSRGYLTFFVSGGPGGYRVTIEREEKHEKQSKRESIYDSGAKLEQGDFFAVSLIQPGDYSVSNILPKPPLDSQVTLDPAKPTGRPLTEVSPVVVECLEKEFVFSLDGKPFDPAKDHLQTNQGLSFIIKAYSVLVLAHKNPDQNLGGTPFRSVRWRNPSHIASDDPGPKPQTRQKESGD